MVNSAPQISRSVVAPDLPAGLRSAHALRAGLDKATAHLLSMRTTAGHWVGELSPSALSTATAVAALAIYGRNCGATFDRPIRMGLDWLSANNNADGGWGDTTRSLSNLSTTALGWAAFGAANGAQGRDQVTVRRAEQWLARKIGVSEEEFPQSHDRLAQAIIERYGKDRTFSAPILTLCALSGRLGTGAGAWRNVIQLPFELAALPHQFFATLRLPVVSYALPALIAIGQARHFHLPTTNRLACGARNLARNRTLKLLRQIQPESGGFLEATPLTSFVLMSLAGIKQAQHPTAAAAARFLVRSQRPDGSWPIDSNLATWVTTLAVSALESAECLGKQGAGQIQDWLLQQQFGVEHPYTHARPGGWGWTDLPGGLPDADDTAGALVALARLSGATCGSDELTLKATIAGIEWLLHWQNRDGGIPTFCRGWGALPFDRSSPDLTAHVILAWMRWLDHIPAPLGERVAGGIGRSLRYLQRCQRADGAWVPLWFGNQHAPQEENPLYGTARVLRTLGPVSRRFPAAQPQVERALFWLLRARNPDGGWGGAVAVESTIEETALAVEALADTLAAGTVPEGASHSVREALSAGTGWLLARIDSGEWTHPTPIGFYFAKLWYWEKLYPVIFTVAALSASLRALPPDKRV